MLRLQNKAKSLNRNQSLNFWWLIFTNHAMFDEKCVFEKFIFLEEMSPNSKLPPRN